MGIHRDSDQARLDEDAAWGSVWLHGDWHWLTRNMTTEQRTAAADAVERNWAVAMADDPGLTFDASADGLRWWLA